LFGDGVGEGVVVLVGVNCVLVVGGLVMIGDWLDEDGVVDRLDEDGVVDRLDEDGVVPV
jgi:hypothetical protein